MWFISVYESKYGLCNVYGTLHDCGVDSRSKCSRCTCKEGYFGARCQYCYNNPKYTVFEGINGTVQSVTGKGIWCGKETHNSTLNASKENVAYKHISGQTSVLIAGGYNGKELTTVEVLGEKCKIPDLPKKISYIPSIINHEKFVKLTKFSQQTRTILGSGYY